MSAALIVQRRSQMLTHCYLYYELDQPIISDDQWQRWALELADLQRAHPEPVGFYDKAFQDWTGETGFHLPRGGIEHVRATHVLKLHNNPDLRAAPASIAAEPEPANLRNFASSDEPGQLVRGRIVSTSYGTGPYKITDVQGPCTCPSYSDSINGKGKPPKATAPHFHITVEDMDPPKGKRDTRGWLNGFRSDGTCVWSDDRLIFGDLVSGAQHDLFGF